MAQAKGAHAKLLMDFETAFGADPASPNGLVMPFNSCSLTTKRDLITPQTITGDRNPVMSIEGNVECNGTAVIPVDALNFGWWLKAMMGPPVTTGGPVYVHTFKVPATLPSMVMEMGYTDITQYFKYNGVKVQSMGLEFKGKEAELVANIELMGAKRTLSGTSYDASPTTTAFSRFQMKQLAILEGGSAFALAGSVSVSFKNSLDGESWVIGGGGVRGDLPEDVVEVSGTLKAMFTSAALYTKAINSTETSLKLTATNGANILEIFIPEMKYAETDPQHVRGGIWAELPFSGYYENNADSTALKITLTNSQASYA